MEWIEFRCWFPLLSSLAMAEVLGAITCARRAIYLTALDIRMAE